MAHMITVTANKYNDEGIIEIDEPISINADNINIIEDSKLNIREKSRIIFNDDSSIYVVETKEYLQNLINGK